jgi:hypothetical protein
MSIRTSFIFILTFLASSQVSGQTMNPMDCVAILDENGNRLGRVQDGGSYSTTIVFVELGEAIFRIQVRGNKIAGDGSLRSTSTCAEPESGIRFLTNQPEALFAEVSIQEDGTIWVPDINAGLQTFTINSVIQPTGDCVDQSGPEILGFLAIEYPNLLSQFTPPFHPEVETCTSTTVASLTPQGLMMICLLMAGCYAWLLRSRQHVRRARARAH